jgi:hypothetical protein
MKLFYFCIFLSYVQICTAQKVDFSTPEKISDDFVSTDILGKSSQGIVVDVIGKAEHTIKIFAPDMSLRWSRHLVLRDLDGDIQSVFYTHDSLLVIYTLKEKRDQLLKAALFNLQLLESYKPALIVDTLNKTSFTEADISFAQSDDHNSILIYLKNKDFSDTKKLRVYLLLANAEKVPWAELHVTKFDNPDLIDCCIDNNGNVFFLTGSISDTYHNNFSYSTFQITRFSFSDKTASTNVLAAPNYYLTAPKWAFDNTNQRIILSGLYASDRGTAADGIYFITASMSDVAFAAPVFQSFSPDLLTKITGNSPPKKYDRFDNFLPGSLTVTANGGAVFTAEAVYITSQGNNINNPISPFYSPYYYNPYSPFGYPDNQQNTKYFYHYEDIIGLLLTPDGKIDWQQGMLKKQLTEDDGGFYSSYAVLEAPDELHLIYNDFINTQTNVSQFALSPEGNAERQDLFSADKKGVMLVPNASKQIDVNEIIIPSIKKDFIQFVKFTF